MSQMVTRRSPFWDKLAQHLARFWLWDVILLLALLYLVQRLYRLTIIPVFADEAIYIYWSQLAAADWSRYLFFALNDGKTPLVIWANIPLLKLCADPLVAGRLTSILFGLGQLLVTMYTVNIMTTKKRYMLLAGLLVIMCPGLMLTNRLALMDTAVSFFISLTFLLTYIATQFFLLATFDPKTFPRRHWWISALAAGISFGLALWTKFSCLLLVPMLATIAFYNVRWSQLRHKGGIKELLVTVSFQYIPLVLIYLVGLLVFAGLKVSPAFGMLFSRGGDFLYSFSEFFANPFSIIYHNLVQFVQVLTNYGGLVLTLATFILAFVHAYRRPHYLAPSLLLLTACAYALPIIFLGKVVYPRYYVPVIPFIIASLCLSLAEIRRLTLVNLKLSLIIVILLTGLYWSWMMYTAPAKLPLLPIDREQLFTEWSAGYGIKPTVEYLEQLAQQQNLLVLTEGFVGTLPDGLQIYLQKSPVRDHIRVLGLGAPPVRHFDEVLANEDLDSYDQVLLVVNSHRLELDEGLGPYELIHEYPRPVRTAPMLQIWRIN